MKAIKITPENCVSLVDVQNELQALQEAVGGYIETIGLQDGAVMIVDEEGRFKDYPVNLIASVTAGVEIVGIVLIVGTDEDEFDDVPETYLELLRCGEV